MLTLGHHASQPFIVGSVLFNITVNVSKGNLELKERFRNQPVWRHSLSLAWNFHLKLKFLAQYELEWRSISQEMEESSVIFVVQYF